MKRWLWWLGLLSLILLSRATVSAQQDATIIVQGRVIQATTDGRPLPENLPVELQVIDVEAVQTTFTQVALTQPDGGFVFTNVPRVEGQDFYLLYTTYGGVRQRTQPLYTNQVDFVTFPVYETTAVLDGVEIISGRMQITRFSMGPQSGTNLEVLLEMQIISRGDRILYSHQGGLAASFSFELPVGAFGIAEVTPDNDPTPTLRIVESGAIPLVQDTLPLVPLWPRPRTIRVTYLLPYGQEAIIDQPFLVPVSHFEVWVPADAVELTSDMLVLQDEARVVEDGASTYRVYRQLQPLAAGTSLLFTLHGTPHNSQNIRTRLVQDKGSANLRGVALMVGAVMIALVGGVAWWRQRRRHFRLTGFVNADKATRE